MRRLGSMLVLPLVVVSLLACEPRPRGPKLRLNDIQVLASHNSYHVEPEPRLLDLLRGFLGDADGFQYTHMPLAEELDHGVRQVELDLFVDTPEGGHYASPKLVPLVGLDPVDPRMSEPGTKVIHIQEVDYRSTCPLFVECLEAIRAWSDAHPNHLPIVIQLEPKDDPITDPGLGFVTPIPWDGSAFATVEQEILSVFSRQRIITPATVQGRRPSLRDAVLHDRWLRLADARGQVMFMLDDVGEERQAYRSLRPDVAERLIFVAAEPPDDDAAVVVVNNPVADADRIRALVEQGFMVRTRADADTVEARTGDTARRDAAWASGAQFVSTDYVVADERFGTDYSVQVPGGAVARCNPISAPRRCNGAQLAE